MTTRIVADDASGLNFKIPSKFLLSLFLLSCLCLFLFYSDPMNFSLGEMEHPQNAKPSLRALGFTKTNILNKTSTDINSKEAVRSLSQRHLTASLSFPCVTSVKSRIFKHENAEKKRKAKSCGLPTPIHYLQQHMGPFPYLSSSFLPQKQKQPSLSRFAANPVFVPEQCLCHHYYFPRLPPPPARCGLSLREEGGGRPLRGEARAAIGRRSLSLQFRVGFKAPPFW